MESWSDASVFKIQAWACGDGHLKGLEWGWKICHIIELNDKHT